MKTSFKLILFVALWLVPSHQCRSQTIRGKVYADTEAAFAANVFLKHHTDIHTITDEEGQFELPLQDGILPDTLMVTYVGYKAKPSRQSHHKAVIKCHKPIRGNNYGRCHFE